MARSYPQLRRWALCGLPVLLVALCYRSTLDHPFVYDDHRTVLENASLQRPVDWDAVLYFDRFRPAVSLTYLADYLRGGRDPATFRATNLALHAADSILLYWVMMALLADLAKRRDATVGSSGAGKTAATARVWIAAAVASIFAVHPLMTESVVYVTGRSESLCALFFFGAVLAFRRDVLARTTAARWGWRTSWLVFWLLALASKEVAAAFPFVALAWDRLLLDEGPSRSRFWRLHAPLIASTVLAGSARLIALLTQEVGSLPRPFLHHLLSEPAVVARYAGLLVWPHPLSIVHPVTLQTSPLALGTVLPSLAVVVALIAAWRLRATRPWWLLGLVWFLFCLLPSTVIPLLELMAEHRAYLASAGLLLAAGAEAATWTTTRRGGGAARWPLAVVAGLVLLLATLTVRRTEVWADPVELWADAASHAEGSWAPHFGLGAALQRDGRCAEAIPSYARAVELRPDAVDARVNLGVCLAESGDPEAAYRAFLEAVQEAPQHAPLYNNLARLELMAGRVDAARDWLERGLEIDPANVRARMGLAFIHERYDDDPSAALGLCHEVRALAPRTPGVVDCIERNQARLSPGVGAPMPSGGPS